MAVAAASLAIFAMIYGTRRYEGAGRNDAVLFAVGVEFGRGRGFITGFRATAFGRGSLHDSIAREAVVKEQETIIRDNRF